MMRVSKRTAALLGAVTMAGTAGLTALAPSAVAGTVTVQAACKVPIVGDQNGPQEIKVDFTPVEGPAGTTVTATVDLGPPPIKSPIAVSNAKAQSTLQLTMSGAATGTIDLAGPEVTLDIPANVPINPAPFTKTFTIPAGASAGDIAFTPKGTINNTDIPGFGKQVANCTFTGGGTVASFKVKPLAPGEVSLSATPAEVAVGGTTALAGANWPDGTPTVEICKAADCKADRIATKDVKVLAGALSGNIALAESVTPGDYTVKVTVADKFKETALKVKAKPAPEITLTPASGKVNEKTTVAGVNFPPSKEVTVSGLKADGSATSDTPVKKAAGADGSFSVDFVVKDKDTVKVKAKSDQAEDTADYTVKTDDPSPSPSPSVTPPADPNGVEVQVSYVCKTVVTGVSIPIPDMTPSLGVKILVPSRGAKDQQVDLQVVFKDQVISDIPSVAGDAQKGLMAKLTPTMKVVVSDGRNAPGTVSATTGPIDVDMTPGGKMKGGPLTGKFTIPGGGTFSFSPGELVLKIDVPFAGSTVVATATCTTTGTVPVSATLVAEGAPGGAPGQQTGGTSAGNTGGSTGGDLAKTGSGGSTISAFALIAGTAVLAAVGVLLLVPYRRRLRTRG